MCIFVIYIYIYIYILYCQYSGVYNISSVVSYYIELLIKMSFAIKFTVSEN